MSKTYIIAEIGCNHNGSTELARRMILQAKQCGADAVKFQLFNTDKLVSRFAKKAEYQKRAIGSSDSQREMLKQLELSKPDYLRLRDYALELGIDVFATAFDLESVLFLKQSGQSIWKIPSGEITDYPLLKMVGEIKCPQKKVLISTGMASLAEISECLNVLENTGNNKKDLTILHCNTEYPTPDCDVNISAINDFKESFPGYQVGLSDHSLGSMAAVMAIALGATIVEKHFTLDRNLPGPDHKASSTPDKFREMCVEIRRAELMLGEGKKIVTDSEKSNKVAARKSIVAACDIKRGDVLNEGNMTCKRPGNGISPMLWGSLCGKTADRDYFTDELLRIPGFDWQD